ncbi:hypothetical protein V501_06290 [Pseudogymnoascus sp. VKM F-4519 (FW-2642)]|nr:hypothetical protein V501_06290 [Pseudogymnoascus sp. VKM F-4519 (FW-2642)]
MRVPSPLAVLAAAAAAAVVVDAQQGAYSQCHPLLSLPEKPATNNLKGGGTAWAGPTTCASGLKCVILK